MNVVVVHAQCYGISSRNRTAKWWSVRVGALQILQDTRPQEGNEVTVKHRHRIFIIGNEGYK